MILSLALSSRLLLNLSRIVRKRCLSRGLELDCIYKGNKDGVANLMIISLALSCPASRLLLNLSRIVRKRCLSRGLGTNFFSR